METCRILLADDHRVVTEGIRSLLALRKDLQIVGEARDGMEALEMAESLRPHIIIMDISMPRLSGVEAAQLLASRCPGTRVIIYTMHSDQRFILELFRAGIAALVLKEDDPQELVRAVDCVREGGVTYGKYDPKHMLSELLQSTADASETGRIHALSPREKEVFRLLADGLSVKGIATQLHISPKTVETHKYNVLEKLAVENLTELTKLAIRHGLIEA